MGAGSPGLIGWLCAEFSGSLASPPPAPSSVLLVPDRLVLCPLGRCALVGLACEAAAAAEAGERVSEREGRARVVVSHRYLER